MEKRKLYSYIRWSSDKQAKGSSLQRQLETARRVAHENSLELVEIIDAGLSAFKSKHLEHGNLGAFIAAVKAGQIANDSWLTVESLDRISRDEILKAQRLFMELLELGITIYTGMDNRIYTKTSVTDNPMELMLSIMTFSRANQESMVKSQRQKSAAQLKIDKFKAGGRADNGYPFAIRSSGASVFWSDVSDGTVKPHQYYFPIAKLIVSLRLKGWGYVRIAKHLNENFTPPKGTAKRKYFKDMWSPKLVCNFLQSRTLMGEKSIRVDGVEHILKDYYPQVMTESEFYGLQSVINRKLTNEPRDYIPLLSGIRRFKCVCGAPMVAFYQYDKIRYRCDGMKSLDKRMHCGAKSFNGAAIENAIVQICADKIFKDIKHHASNVDAIQAELNDTQKKYKRGMDMILEDNAPSGLNIMLVEIEKKIEVLQRQLNEELVKDTEVDTSVSWDAVPENYKDVSNIERLEIKQKIQASTLSIICKTAKAKGHLFDITFKDGDLIRFYCDKKVVHVDYKSINNAAAMRAEDIVLHNHFDILIDKDKFIERVQMEHKIAKLLKERTLEDLFDI
ncbi:recombinase family protein [Enterobacteriaceae bacterium H20N1]|uniref:Recombinase family protein n=1 Tax=Dryocola boscaweniae TaxID=2925397 RepID=A0A9X2W5W3_9ENTR|nr:recombinase family protein [Dryocola boscaweniae]MCT4701162.1 recombinase family protein [Dryocola boscaweniae]MCT4718333.1 recombinase family protein [Dryocola boscaweniae]